VFILVINQIDAQNLFDSKFISCLYMFRVPCAYHQGSKLYYTASGIITPVGIITPIGVMIPEAV